MIIKKSLYQNFERNILFINEIMKIENFCYYTRIDPLYNLKKHKKYNDATYIANNNNKKLEKKVIAKYYYIRIFLFLIHVTLYLYIRYVYCICK